MALIACAECKKEVSDQAGSCPHCGCPIQQGAPSPVTEKKEKKSPIRTGVFGCLGFFLIAGIIGTVIEQFNNSESGGQIGTFANRAAPQKVIKPIEVTALDLHSSYKKNEVAADMRFKGKYVMVSGRIESIGKDILNNMYVSLKSQKNRYQMLGFIQCFFGSRYKQQLANLSKGQQVVLLGKVSGKMGNILVKNCRVMK